MDLMVIQFLSLWLFLANFAGFALMGLDKGKAKSGDWRISEKALFLPAILGGAWGSTAGMRVFRHKTKHWYFRWGLPLLAILQTGFLIWMILFFARK